MCSRLGLSERLEEVRECDEPWNCTNYVSRLSKKYLEAHGEQTLMEVSVVVMVGRKYSRLE